MRTSMTQTTSTSFTANHDTRKLHMSARHVERAVSVLSWCCVIHTSLAQVVFESSLHPIFMHELLSLTSLSSLSTSTWPSPSSSTPLSWCTEHYSDLDNFDTVQTDLRHSAHWSNDAYDVTDSLTGIVDLVHQKAGLDDRRLKTMVNRSFEQNFHELRILRPETEIMKEVSWSRTKQRGQRVLGMGNQRTVF